MKVYITYRHLLASTDFTSLDCDLLRTMYIPGLLLSIEDPMAISQNHQTLSLSLQELLSDSIDVLVDAS